MTPLALADLLRARRDDIVARFVTETQRKELSPPGVPRSKIVDHIPSFLDEIAAEVARVPEVRMSHDALETSATARLHGEQRWELGYDLEGLTREYGILRHCILQVIKEARGELTIDEVDVLSKCLSVGVAEAATEYVKYRDRQLDAQKESLEFLAEAGVLLSSSLDHRSTLSRLTELLVPRLADWCAVHLDGESADDMPLAHVDPAKLSVLRDIYRYFPLPSDATYGHAQVVRTGKPEYVPEVEPGPLDRAAQGPAHLALLRAINVVSWMVVPLRVQGNTIGALTLAYSDSGRRYSPHDLVLAEEIARRAAVAIDNARLYALSQTERSRVETATRAKDEFVAMISHELRTPLNAILGWLRLMRGGKMPDAKREHALAVIERNAHAQSQLVGDLLDISRAVTGKLHINPSRVDLSSIVDPAIEGARPAIDAKRIHLEVDVDRESPLVHGDVDRLQQVIGNILSNAVKFTPKAGRIRIRLRRVDADFELTVEDNGEGISESFLPHVFESFRQSDGSSSRSHGGLGIGLSIAKHIVELHGGSVRAESRGLGLGATFAVRLPVSPIASKPSDAPRAVGTREGSADSVLPAALRGIRILLVEDEPDARELLMYVLETCGMEVAVAGSVAEAMTTLESYTPHVIISDIGMPNEDGYSLSRSVRMLPSEEKRSIPAIALTAFARNEDRARALVAGFNLHMTKPVEPTTLVSAVLDLTRQVRL